MPQKRVVIIDRGQKLVIFNNA